MIDRQPYLKTRQLAEALGVSCSTVKRWVDNGSIEATRTTGKHRLVSLATALKFAKFWKYPTEGLQALSDAPTIDAITADVIESLVEALKTGNDRAASSIVTSVFLPDRNAVDLSDQLIRPTMERIGQLWMLGTIDIYQEHQATQIIVGVLGELIRQVSRKDRSGLPIALGAAPEGDIYSLPVLLGELVLREGGWDVRNLGSNLPFRSFAQAIRAYRPKLVFLSTSVAADKVRFLQEYSYFYEAASQVGAAIILGGRALDADLRSRLVFASFGDRMAHLAEFARRLHPVEQLGPEIDTHTAERTATSN